MKEGHIEENTKYSLITVFFHFSPSTMIAQLFEF